MNSLRLRLVLGCSLGLLGVLFLGLLLGVLLLREWHLRQGAEALQQQQRLLAAGLSQVFARTELRARELAHQVQHSQPDADQVLALMTAKVLNDGESVQAGLFLEQDNPIDPKGRVGLSVAYGASGVQVTNFVSSGYKFWDMDWYQRTLRSEDGWWSDPYFNDAAGGQDTITYDFPLRDAAGRYYGSLSFSVSLDRIAEIIETLGGQGLARQSDQVLIDARGDLVLFWQHRLDRGSRIDEASGQRNSVTPDWWQALDARQADGPQRLRDRSVAQAVVERVDWRIAASLADADVLAPLYRAAVWTAALCLLLCLLLAWWVNRFWSQLMQPLQRLTVETERLAAGELEQSVTVSAGHDAVSRLSAAIERARLALEDNLGRARMESDARHRAEGELHLATALQRSLLPEDRLFFGPELQAQICARLIPAAAVAGDLYGFVSAAPGICVFYLADVRGQGVASVLFMSRLAALLPAAIRQGGDPAQVIAGVAELLLQTDDQQWGADVLVGRLDLHDGSLQLASAGYPAPLLLNDSGQRTLPLQVGPSLSRESFAGWHTSSTMLRAGDRLFLFSDGLSRAHDAAGGELGLDVIQVALERHAELAPALLLPALFAEVQSLGDAVIQDDLVAMLLVVQHRH